MQRLHAIERDNKRVRDVRWGPRTLDLDLLFHGDAILDDGLTVPHPRLHERRFVLAPLAEVGGGFVHPVLKKTVANLLADLPADDLDDVKRLEGAWSPSP